ncbi:MAG: ABC transporter ATP-binding protein [Bdellovibrionaceae bacterium]|nr:ABC transporter ATP-binding protein [Pseudobdellovibrionaceae bacterium]
MELAIEIRNLKKSFGGRSVVNGVTFDVPKGECFGLLGPNGAGKTTILRMLSGSTRVQEGELFMLGLSIQSSLREIKSRIGVVPQGDGLDPELTVFENLLIYSRYLGFQGLGAEDRIHELLKSVALDDRAEQLVDTLSGGLKRRLAFIRALLADPELLILDEPTAQLDPQARNWTWDFLRGERERGRTIIITTHDMTEAELLCDRVALISKGRLIDLETPKNLIEKYWGPEVIELKMNRTDIGYYSNRLRERKVEYQVFGDSILAKTTPEFTQGDLFKGFKSPLMAVRKPNLNDVFLKLTGTGLQEGESI